MEDITVDKIKERIRENARRARERYSFEVSIPKKSQLPRLLIAYLSNLSLRKKRFRIWKTGWSHYYGNMACAMPGLSRGSLFLRTWRKSFI
jgi:hypothetical protein